MKPLSRFLISLTAMLALAPPLILTGCAARVSTGYRVYDPDYRDYHAWDDGETVYYGRWESENHKQHRNFRKRSKNERKEYWEWRHNQH